MFCVNGHDNPAGQRFCGTCGVALAGAAGAAAELQPAPGPKPIWRPWWAWVSGIVAVLLVAGIVGISSSHERAASGTPSVPASTGQAPASPAALLGPQPAPLGTQGEFFGTVALGQPAGRAAAAYLQARASAAVTPEALAALPSFFAPLSPDITRETYLARGEHARWIGAGTPPARTIDSLDPASVSLTVVNYTATFQGSTIDMTSFASGRSDQEGSGLDHTVELKWVGGRWLVQQDAYLDDTAPSALEKGGAPSQMVAAAEAEVNFTEGAPGPADVGAAKSAVRTFVRLVDQGRYPAAQRLVHVGSHVSAQELGREVASLTWQRATVPGVPSNASIELETMLRVQPRASSTWSSGVQHVYFTVTREWFGQPWLISDYSSLSSVP